MVVQVGVWPARKLESLAALPQHHFLLHRCLMMMRSHMQRVTGLHTTAAAEGTENIKSIVRIRRKCRHEGIVKHQTYLNTVCNKNNNTIIILLLAIMTS
jgi:hypothetical protein